MTSGVKGITVLQEGFAATAIRGWRALGKMTTHAYCAAATRTREAVCALRAAPQGERGQGTTEYAILVGVLVVMAILAIALFRPRLQELWDAIAEGINGL